MTSIQPAMFLNDVTAIDHALISVTGQVIGGSVSPQIIVRGPMDSDESVVVDFSTIKKFLKNTIDHNLNGYDHKLLVDLEDASLKVSLLDGDGRWLADVKKMFPGYANINNTEIAREFKSDASVQGDYIVEITTPATILDMPLNAVKFYRGDLARAIQSYLLPELAKSYPGCTCTLELHEDYRSMSMAPGSNFESLLSPFRYVHGLKDSTSWGCQNIAHGHASFLQMHCQKEQLDAVESLMDDIYYHINDVVFINRANLTKPFPDELVGKRCGTIDAPKVDIQYKTGRGSFAMSIIRPELQPYIVLDSETTVEYLAAFIESTYGADLDKIGITKAYVSEGLAKGALIR